jgi:hypothetical protein
MAAFSWSVKTQHFVRQIAARRGGCKRRSAWDGLACIVLYVAWGGGASRVPEPRDPCLVVATTNQDWEDFL